MKRIKTIILTIFVIVFCLQAKEVADTMFYTSIFYDINNGIITSTRDNIQEYEYDVNGLLKRTISYEKNLENHFFKFIVTEFDIYGNIQKYTSYNTDGSMSGENHFKNTMITINSKNLLKQQVIEYSSGFKNIKDYEYCDNGDTTSLVESNYRVNGTLFRRTKYEYKYDFNGYDCFVSGVIKNYNENEELTTIIPEERYYKFFTIDSNKFLEIYIRVDYNSDGTERRRVKFENNYNSKGLLTKQTVYIQVAGTVNYIKTEEHIRSYTYKKIIITTAIYGKQEMRTKNNFQISRNSNTLNLNFADNSKKRIEIINLQGKILNSQKFSSETYNINIGNLPKNVYILRIFKNGEINSVKFVK